MLVKKYIETFKNFFKFDRNKNLVVKLKEFVKEIKYLTKVSRKFIWL